MAKSQEFSQSRMLEAPSPRELLVVAAAAGVIAVLARENRIFRRRAEIDAKTGLLLPEYFRDKVIRRTAHTRRASDRGRVHGLAFLDLDDFKGYNTARGHPWVDRHLLIPAARAIVAATRSSEDDASDLTCRFGGEEFVVFLSDVGDPEGLLKGAERIQAYINAIDPTFNPRQPDRLGVSIGCSLLPQGGGYNNALQAANDAMGQAKNKPGKNQIVVSEAV